jgi:hypothetical protein
VVAVEEMLHLTLVANVLNAVGGDPDLMVPGFVPRYPTHLPDGETDFEVSLRPFSPAALETFLRIERSASVMGDDLGLVEREHSPRALLPAFAPDAEAELVDDDAELHFFSIGEFYQEIDRGMRALHRTLAARGEDLFAGDPRRQVTAEQYYSGGGDVVAVVDLESACEAMRLIGEQGEGLGGAIYDREGEISHYYRFDQLVHRRYYQPGDAAGQPSGAAFDVDWAAVYPVKVDAQLCDYPEGSEVLDAVVSFGDAYQGFLAQLTAAFTGRPELLMEAVGEMFRIRDLATLIMRNPIPGAGGANAAPVFGDLGASVVHPSGGHASVVHDLTEAGLPR